MRENYTNKQIKKHIENAEKTTIVKSNSEFLFTREYFDFDGNRKSIQLILLVNYKTKRFEIINEESDFHYCKLENISDHRAVLTVMAEAYEYGVKEISK